MTLSTLSISRKSAERPKTTIAIWIGTLVLAFVLISTLLESALTTEFVFTNTPESQRGVDLIEELRGQPISTNEVVIVRSDTFTVDDAEFQAEVEAVWGEIDALGEEVIRPGSFTNFYRTDIPDTSGLVSADRRTTIMPFVTAGTFLDATDNVPLVLDIVENRNAASDFTVLLTGQATIGNAFEDVGQEDFLRGESIGVPVAMIILLIVFGTVVAAFVPIVIAIISIIIAMGIAALVGQVFALSFFVQNVIFMIGLAVGVDYSLFIVDRYREERRNGLQKLDAIERAGNTASRAVLFSGITVVLALFGMLLVPFNVFIGLGIGAIVVVIASVVAALTLLPAVMSLLGDKLERLKVPGIARPKKNNYEANVGGFWDSASHMVMRKPLLSLIVGGGLLVAAAYPLLDLSLGFAGVTTLSQDIQARQGFDILDGEFSDGATSPARIVIAGDFDSAAVQSGIVAITAAMASDAESAFGKPKEAEVNASRTIALIAVPMSGDTAEEFAQDAIVRLRDIYIPAAFAGSGAEVVVTGETAFNMDFFQAAKDGILVVFPFVLGMSFILLMLVFRSIIVPIKAILLNLLSVAATYGLLVLFFQKGVGADLGLLSEFDIIEAWIPLFLFTILFGLSMDYHVFLLSRIRERYDQTGDNTESVAFGVRATGRLITGAALIMVAVFWGFAAGDLIGLQQMGFGLGTAILIDATIVRMVLVPASMKMLGEWNWYLPGFLNWLPDLRVGSGDDTHAPDPAAAGD
ncbi:MAG: MMPL family transporter [Chloroflexi bacterium]|nr:MMPL family transporter [Chloroflexota bacterium]